MSEDFIIKIMLCVASILLSLEVISLKNKIKNIEKEQIENEKNKRKM